MGLFSKLKLLFNKNVTLMPHQKNDLVSFVKLRGNKIKINSRVEVNEGYNFVIVYYNKVCDILPKGYFKINEDTIPKLYRYSKTPSGIGKLSVKAINADAYYVNLKEFPQNHFKTIDRVITFYNKEKVKIKLEGTFTLRVTDTAKFMKALCNDYAIIRNKKTIKEICSTISFEIAKALNKKDFTLEEYWNNRQKIISSIEENVNSHSFTFGVQVSNFSINNIILPKKFIKQQQFNQLEKSKNKEILVNNTTLKKAEERLDNLQQDLNVVYANGQENKKENVNNKDLDNRNLDNRNIDSGNRNTNNNSNIVDLDVVEKQINLNFSKNYKNIEDESKKQLENNNINNKVSQNKISSGFDIDAIYKPPSNYHSQPEPQIINNNKDKEPIVIDDVLVDKLIDKMEKRKKQRKNNRIVEILSKTSLKQNEDNINVTENKETGTNENSVHKKTCGVCGEKVNGNAKFCSKCGSLLDSLKVCACCGAKNFSDAKVCCLCKSKLD